jgi:hypothetical protein
MLGDHLNIQHFLLTSYRSLLFQPARRTKHNFFTQKICPLLVLFLPFVNESLPWLGHVSHKIERKSKLGFYGKNKSLATFSLKVTRKESRVVCVWMYALRRVLTQEDQCDEVVDGQDAGQPVPVEVQPHPQATTFITFPYK